MRSRVGRSPGSSAVNATSVISGVVAFQSPASTDEILVSPNAINENGTELKIVRHNMPFGEIGTGQFGTYFIGYSRTAAVTEQMLHNMFIGDPPANTDRILDFSTALTGTMFFTPTVDFLNNPPPLPGSVSAQPPEVTVAPVSQHGSLGIGSLKGTTR